MKKKKLSVIFMERILLLIVSLLVTFRLLLPTNLVGADDTILLPSIENFVHVSPRVETILEIEGPPKGNLKLGSSLNQLLEVKRCKDLAEAQAFSIRHKMGIKDNRIQVTIVTTEEAIDDVRDTVAMMGGEYQLHYRNLLQAMVPIDALEMLVERSDVQFVRQPYRTIPMLGSATTEGVAAMNAEAWHTAGNMGNGVHVAIIDAGFDGYAGLLGVDLPASVNTYDWTGAGIGGSVHGTACAEVVYDVAPEVTMDLHKVGTGVELANAVNQAISDGVNIISMSLVWPVGGPGDGTGFFSDILHTARSNGILYVTAAGNYAEHSWSGTYTDTDSDNIHEWVSGVQNINYFGAGDGTAYVIPVGFPIELPLHWDDWTAVEQDYDMELYYWDGSSWIYVTGSYNFQNGGAGQIPIEYIKIDAPVEAPYGVVIQKRSATRDVCLRLLSSLPLDEQVAERSLGFPADSPDAITVAAIDVSSYSLEPYSSQGPTFGPGGACAGGLIKPDISGYANVSTVSYGSGGFNGTSAATAHVAGATALVLTANPSCTPDQLRSFLETHAIDMGPPGKDTQFGYGRLYLADPDVPFYQVLIFPHIASGSDWETEIAVINTSDSQALNGKLRAYNDEGEEVSESMTITLASHARREITIGNEFIDPGEIDYIVFETAAGSSVKGYTKFYIEGQYRVAVPGVSEINSGDIYISHIASTQSWWTGISLVNTTSSTKALSIEFDNGEIKTKTLAANEHSAFTIRSLFNEQAQPNTHSAVIKNGSGIVGLELFGSTTIGGNNYLSGILLKDDSTTQMYYPHIASDSMWWTGVVAYNPFTSPCDITITPYSAEGGALPSQGLAISGIGKYIGTIADLNLPFDTAWFEIKASSPITGFELFGTRDGSQLGGYTAVDINSTEGIFAKLEKYGWTGIAFVNIKDASTTVTLTAYDDNGNTVATETMSLSPHEKVVNLAERIFTQDISTATYIRYSSNKEVVGFQLNGSSDNMMLDGLPGM